MLCFALEIRVAFMGKATATERAALPIPVSVCRISVCPNNDIRLPAFVNFNARTDVEACDCTRELYAKNARESVPKADSGRICPYHTGESNPCQYNTTNNVFFICCFSKVEHITHCKAEEPKDSKNKLSRVRAHAHTLTHTIIIIGT